MSIQNIEVLIDELVVNGATGVDRDRFRTQVELELGRIVQEEGGLPRLAEPTDSRAVAPVQIVTVAPGQTPNATHVARAIHGAIKQ